MGNPRFGRNKTSSFFFRFCLSLQKALKTKTANTTKHNTTNTKQQQKRTLMATQEGSYDPPLPTILEEIEKKLDKNNLTAATLRNVRDATTYVELLYLSLCTYPSFPVTCEIDGLGKEVDGSRKTYLKLAEEAVAVADSLRKENIQKGERIALLFLGSSNLFSAFYGCMLVGVLPIVLPPPIKMAADLPMFNALVKALGINHVISHNLYHQVSSIQNVSHRFSTLFKTEAATWPTHIKWHFIENLTKSSSHFGISSSSSSSTSSSSYEKLKERFHEYSKEIKPNDLAFLQLTSGSTNHPKAVMVPHSSLVLSVLKLSMAALGTPSSPNLPFYYGFFFFFFLFFFLFSFPPLSFHLLSLTLTLSLSLSHSLTLSLSLSFPLSPSPLSPQVPNSTPPLILSQLSLLPHVLSTLSKKMRGGRRCWHGCLLIMIFIGGCGRRLCCWGILF